MVMKIIKFFIEHWYVGIIESALASALWKVYPTLENDLAKVTLVFGIIVVFYLPGYLGLYGLYKMIKDNKK
jgi:hypothetical protein